ncbi:MAG: flippase-like protein [Flaviaesturariibacter sp.]|nr:flippase-like protein [Flaviaesturariibacter sp.]
MKKYILTIFQYLFFVGLGFFFVWLSVKDIHQEQWLQIKDALSRARRWLLIPAVILLLIAHYSRALRWKILMEPMGYKPSHFNVFAAVMIGYLVNAGVPRLGEVVKCSMLARYEKVRVDRLVGTIVMERAVDVICLLIVFASALIFEGHVIGEHIGARFSSFFSDNTGHTSLQKIGIVLGSLVVILAIIYALLKRFGHIDAVAKVKHVLTGILHGLSSIRQVQHKGLFIFHTFLIWACYLAGTTVGIYALQETAHLGIGGGLTTLALGSIGMVVSPGGIGAYAWIVAKLMGWYGLPEETIGNALGWLLWSFQTMIILVGGLVCFGLLSYFNKGKQPQTVVLPTTDIEMLKPKNQQ